MKPADVFIGYHADTAASVVLQACERVGGHHSLGDRQQDVSMDTGSLSNPYTCFSYNNPVKGYVFLLASKVKLRTFYK